MTDPMDIGYYDVPPVERASIRAEVIEQLMWEGTQERDLSESWIRELVIERYLDEQQNAPSLAFASISDMDWDALDDVDLDNHPF